MFQAILKRWADNHLARENAALHIDLAEARSKLRIAELEIDTLTAVIARNIKRVEAETAAAAATIANAENI